jgi:hypothetical protein
MYLDVLRFGRGKAAGPLGNFFEQRGDVDGQQFDFRVRGVAAGEQEQVLQKMRGGFTLRDHGGDGLAVLVLGALVSESELAGGKDHRDGGA